MDNNDMRVHIALLDQQVEQLEKKIEKMNQELEGIRNKGLMISGAIALLVILGGLVGWVLNAMEKLSKIKI